LVVVVDSEKSAVERAFQLAREGVCKTVTEIESILHREGYPRDQIVGRTLRKQLREVIKARQLREGT
jgi:hypothetical protein